MPNRDWIEMKPLLMQAWPSLPEPQLDATQGDREALLEVITSQVGIDRQAAEAELDALLGDEDDVPVQQSSGQPIDNSQPADAANARDAAPYAEGEQATSGIGQEGTPAADASAAAAQRERQRRAS